MKERDNRANANVQVRCRRAGKAVDPRTIRRRGERLVADACPDGAELSILLCDDAFIRELNRDYRGKDQPTDVLSFSMREGDAVGGSEELLGDVVISVETAVRQAVQSNRSTTDEVTSLLIHGFLHLLGHEHKTARKAAEMFRIADQYERFLGFSKR